MKNIIRLIGILAVLSQTPCGHAALVIDSFATGQGPLTGSGTFSAVSGVGILGSERDVLLQSFSAASSFSISGGVLDLAQTSGFSDIFVTYDGTDISSSLSMGLGGLNLLSSGSAFQLSLLSTASSLPHSHLWVRAYTSLSKYSEIHLVFDASNFPSTLSIPFNTMDAFGGGATFSNINAIQMELAIGSGINMDMPIRSFSVVPESSTSILTIISLLFLCFFRKRF